MNKMQKVSNMYNGNIHDLSNLKRCVMEDVRLNLTLADNPGVIERLESYETLIKPDIGYIWSDFEDFTKKVNKQTLLARHEQIFGCTPPKKQSFIDTQLQVWHHMCNNAKNKLVSKVPTTATGRVSKILHSTYSPGTVTEGYGNITTYQAKVCIDLFRECLGKNSSITEKALQDYCIQHRERIKTRQEPWRIFQYYRAKLIEQNILRRQ